MVALPPCTVGMLSVPSGCVISVNPSDKGNPVFQLHQWIKLCGQSDYQVLVSKQGEGKDMQLRWLWSFLTVLSSFGLSKSLSHACIWLTLPEAKSEHSRGSFCQQKWLGQWQTDVSLYMFAKKVSANGSNTYCTLSNEGKTTTS